MLNEKIKKAYIDIVEVITDSNNALINKFTECINNPQEYYKKNYSNYKSRGKDEYTNDNEICFLAMLDLLVDNKYCCELDWKEELNSFMDSLQELKNFISFEPTNLNFKDDILIWCDTINKEWEDKNRCIAEIATASDSYVLFICDNEKLNYLSTLGEIINGKIAKIMLNKEELKRFKTEKDNTTDNPFSKYIDPKELNTKNKMRDKLKNELHWKYNLDYASYWISKIENEFKNGLVSDKFAYRKKIIMRSEQYARILIMYSAGYSIESCKIEYLKLLKLASDSWTGMAGCKKLIEYISLGVLLGVNKDMLVLLEKMISIGKYNDSLIQFFMTYLDGNYNTDIPLQKLPMCYKSLENTILRKCNQSDSLKSLEKYLEKEWCRYNEHWQDNWHESIRYLGYWALEIGAIAKILKLNDESLKKFRYYPYDLVHFDSTISINACKNDYVPPKINTMLDIYNNLNNLYQGKVSYENNTIIWYGNDNRKILITNKHRIVEEKKKFLFTEKWKQRYCTEHHGDYYEMYLELFANILKDKG